jgi:hypothetical protein
MARKKNRKNISILENLTRDVMDTFGLSVTLEGISDEITSELFLEKFTTDRRADIGLYHPDDLLFISNSYPDLPKEFLWTVPPQFENSAGEATWVRGLYKDLKDSFRKNEEIDLSKKFIELFLEYFTQEQNRQWLYANTSENEIQETLTKLIEKYEDDLFELISIEKYKFEVFDKKVTEEINKHLSNNPLAVKHLEKAKLNDQLYLGSSRKVWYWGDGPNGIARAKGLTIKNKRIALVDTSLLNDNVEDFSKPFYTLGYGETEDAGTNNAKLEEGSNFSDFKVSNITADTSAWFSDIRDLPRVGVKNAYNLFFVEFFKVLKLSATREYEYNDQEVTELFNSAIANYLETNIIFNTGFGARAEGPYELPLKDYIAKKLLDTFRYAAWLQNVKDIKPLSDEEAEKANFSDFNKDGFAAGEKAIKESPFSVPTEDEDKPTDEDIEEREKFLKQCMLMTRLDDLANENLLRIASSKNNGLKIHKKNGIFAPYQNRFYMIEDTLYTDGDQSSTVNKLVIPNGNSIREFLDIRPSTHAYLVPKLRFYKIYTGNDGKLKEFPFHFRNFTDSNRVNKLSDVDFDRGGDYGIKEFNFSFDGTNPATAKNDIKANLSLYFQTFSDFIDRKFTDSSGEKHAFVDLLLLPSGKKKEGSGAPAIFQFDAKHYRIRVDVGWEIDSTRVSDLEQSIGVSGANNLRNSIQLMNKSFYLNMVDHTMDFRDDGSVQIDVEYRAYIESALKGTSLDALASPESRKALKLVRADYEAVLSKNRCSAKELNEIRLQLEQIEDLFKKQAYQSIMKRLIKNDSIRYKKVKAGAEQKSFLRRGYFTEKIIFGSDNEEPNEQMSEYSEREKTFTTDESGFNDLKLSDNFLSINFFYLGDLLYAILDTLYNEDGTYIEGFEKFKFVFGSFQYEDLTDASSDAKVINLANIPVSCELFFEWFTDNIIKSERNSYPIMYFIRDLCKFLISEILSESCFKRSFDKTLQFKTMNFMGLSKNEKKDPLGSLYDYSNNDPDVIKDQLTLDVGQKYKAGQLPLANDLNGSNNITDFYNYVTIYVDTPRQKTNKDKTTTRSQDEADGIMHYQIGRDRGILKKIKFSKSDMQYVREARFFRHGHDGLMQLSAVYKVSLDMVGNTLYYPGMEIFIDPLGLVGANSEADPREKRSVANRLGFGGYHLVTSVNSSIGPGKFTTKVDALFSYSGDGDPSSAVVGRKIDVKKDDGKNKIDEAPDNRPQSYKDYCAAIKNKVIDEALEISRGQNYYEPIDYQSAENAFNNDVLNATVVEVDAEERAEQAVDMTADEIVDEIPLDPSRPFSEEFEEEDE